MIKEADVIKQGMDDISIALGFLLGEIEPDPMIDHRTPDEKIHGKVVGSRQEPYHDVTIYEDGYEDWYYLGD